MRLNKTLITRWLLFVLATVFSIAEFASAQVPVAPGAAKAASSAVHQGLSEVPAAAAPVLVESNDDPLGRNTPRGTVLGFLKAAGSDDYDTAVQYLETRQKGEAARKLAQQLREVLDRDASIDVTRLSRKPEGSLANPQNPNREIVGSTSAATGKIPIRLERVTQGADQTPIWLFSAATLEQIPDAYDSLSQPSSTEQKLPGWMRLQFLTIPIWRWLILFAVIPLIVLAGSWLNNLLHPIFAKLARMFAGDKADQKVRSVRSPIRIFLVGMLVLLFGAASTSVVARAFSHSLGLVIVVIGVTWFFTRTVGMFTQLYMARLKRSHSTDKIALTGLIGRLSQIGAVIIAALVLLDMRGVNLTAALTGLGIGGLAVAFAAQKTLENLFGGIMIISDRPIRIGDQCKVGTVEGHVLDIGLRSTSIRTFNRTIVTIPNGQLSIMNVENFTLRDKYWFHHIVTLRYDTPAAQVQAVLGGIRRLLEDDPQVETPTFRVNFIAIQSVSEDIEISAYVFAENPVGFYEAQESLLLKILGVVESAGAQFSLPTQVQINSTGSTAVPPTVANG